MSDNAPVIILTMKWGTLYGPEYVNRLYGGVSRHLSRPFRFVCMTDNADGLRGEVEAYPLPEMVLPPAERDLRWRKLLVFQRPLFDLEGLALFLDLDLLVTGPLDPFFELPGSFRIIRDDHLAPPKPLRWIRPRRARRLVRIGNSSVFRFRIGAHPEVLDDFLRDPQAAITDQPNAREQEYLTEAMRASGHLAYWPRGWCRSFKYHCVPWFPVNFWREPALPQEVRIVTFAGSLNLPEAVSGDWSRWYRRIQPAQWLAQAWRE